MHGNSTKIAALSFLLFLCPLLPLGHAGPTQEGIDFFEKKIRPVLIDKCYRCHSAESEKIKGELYVDSRAGLLKGGSTGPSIVPGDVEKSLLIKAIRHADDDLKMPPKEKLPAEQIKDFEQWIALGAPDPRESSLASAAAKRDIELETARKFWSFQPVRKPELPAVKNAGWAKSPVDYFVLARLEEKGLTPTAAADKRTLIRRATYDLTGLPPTPDEIDAFVRDTSPKAFEKVIDRLLASPHYGEQWGRHWLDVVRYADTSGCNSDFPIPTAYLYRNYVINSFNRDKPYDQFLREQIAGDILPAKTEAQRHEQIIATGYIALGRRFGSRADEFHLTIEDNIDNLGKAALGLSLGCARCHDHKFDPVSMSDYYALYGIFNSTTYAFPGTEIYRHTKDYVPLASKEEAATYYKEAEELAGLDDKIEKLLEKKRAFEREKKTVAKADGASGETSPIERKDRVKPEDLKTIEEVQAALDEARARQRTLENKNYPFLRAYAVREGKPANAKIQRKGEPGNRGDEVPRRFLTVLGGQPVAEPDKTSGRNDLAHWLSDPANPLTARVMVNRIWQHHFGKGIVQTPNDFGTRGKPPTHPELLDYLASEFMAGHWSVKAMHKLIMLSAAYQLSSNFDARNAAIDVNNEYLWRFNRRRLTAEEIRDSMLAIGGGLDRTMGEGHPFPPESQWRYTQHTPFVATYETPRRSVYLMQQRIKKQPYLEIFDGADPNITTSARASGVTPLQALFMMNAPFAFEQADKLAVRIGMAFREDRDRINYAYQLAVGRPATEEEIQMGEAYVSECEKALGGTGLASDQRVRSALASYARVLMSGNEFFFID